MGLLLLLPAGTLRFPGAWRLIAVLFIPMLLLGTVLFLCKPDLLEKRLDQKENEEEQKAVILFSALMFLCAFVLCGLDFRFGWSAVPRRLVITACAVFLLTYAGFAELLRENEYLARTVKVQEGQQVVSTGLCGIVRHPMYAVIFRMFLSMPLITGSLIGLIPMAFLPYVLAKRIKNEETVLLAELKGYKDCTEKVRRRMIPFLR